MSPHLADDLVASSRQLKSRACPREHADSTIGLKLRARAPFSSTAVKWESIAENLMRHCLFHLISSKIQWKLSKKVPQNTPDIQINQLKASKTR